MIIIVKIISVLLLHFFFRFLLPTSLISFMLSSVAIACFFVNLVTVAVNGSSGQGCLTGPCISALTDGYFSVQKKEGYKSILLVDMAI